ncbi:ficolin-2 isoform X2 [Folsomia candida]|uniref:Ficolin-2 n=1 Tax=Folsomia candida TaxID=158441 RepID=A0A226EUN4_FOLCA|nr:ficolin-2 isoform X2 [Folsomia candida]OXA60774.1 Ficolin-2 [Folsomia candida]
MFPNSVSIPRSQKDSGRSFPSDIDTSSNLEVKPLSSASYEGGVNRRRPHWNSVITRNCAEVLVYFPQAPSGIYTIHPIPGTPVEVYCDMDYDGGGWTVIQRRGAPLERGVVRQDFAQGWSAYEKGFGSAEQDYWIGLTNIAAMTRMEDSELVFDLVDWDDEVRFASYKVFQVSNSADDYRLTTGGYVGNAGDGFFAQNNATFSTKDNDKTLNVGNCASLYPGGWWFTKCHSSNINGNYAAEGSNGVAEYAQGITWSRWKGYYHSLKQAQMQIRSKSYKPFW